MTEYERTIYRLVTGSGDHLTAEEVFSALKGEFPSLSLATVYNNLNRLCEAGLLRRITLAGSPDRFDRTEKHDHLVCARCGALSDVRLRDLTASLEEQLGQEVAFDDLKVYWLCPACRQKEAPRRDSNS